MMNPFDPMFAKKRMEDLTTYKPQHDEQEQEQPTKQPRFLRRNKKQDTTPDDKP